MSPSVPSLPVQVTIGAVAFLPVKVLIGSVQVDATLSETFGADVEVTEHPVERGTDVTDHIRPKPETLTLEGIVSNTPISTSGTPSQVSRGAPGPANTALLQLIAIKNSGALVTIVTKRRPYKNMVMTSLSAPRDPKLGEAVRFTASFRQIRIVNSATIGVLTNVAKVQGNKNLGQQAAAPAPAAQPDKSILNQSIDSAGVVKKLVEKLVFGS